MSSIKDATPTRHSSTSRVRVRENRAESETRRRPAVVLEGHASPTSVQAVQAPEQD